MTNDLKTLAIISVGNQAQSWALNLHDSGLRVTIGLRNFHPKAVSFQQKHPDISCVLISYEWLSQQSVLALLIPDDQHFDFLQKNSNAIKPGTLLIYAHGFSEVAYKLSHHFPQYTHSLLAPKSIASELRQNYLEKKTLAAVYSVIPMTNKNQNESKNTEQQLITLARNLGITWGPFPVTFEQECKADLFSEQTLLCNLLPDILAKGYQTMLNKNIPWQLAFCEIFLELKLIVNALENVGPENFFQLISPNALVGSEFYRKEWEGKLHIEKLFESCWKNLESGEMINYLSKANGNDLRTQVLNEWKEKSITKAYNQFKASPSIHQ